jgi:PAS domain S-box-containing protein
MGALAYLSLDTAASATVQSRDALVVMDAVRTVDDHIHDASVAERDLIATGNAQFVAAYTAATDSTLRSLATLRTMAAPYPAVEPRVDSLGYFVHLRLAELDETVRTQREPDAKVAAEVARLQRSNQADRKINELLGAITSTLESSGSRSGMMITDRESLVLAIVVATAAIAIMLAVFVNIMHWRNVRAQARMVEELENQSLQLRLQTDELSKTNRELEDATSEMLRQTIEAERSETRLAGILGSATDAVVSFDDDERIVYVNAAAGRLFTIGDSVLPEVRILRVVAGRSAQIFEEHMLAARRSAHLGAESPEVWDTLIVRPDGSEVPVEVSMAYTRTGKQGLFTAVLRDVTRQRQLEEEFRQSQKMEAVGRLAGGVAHDFNNLLTVIGASSDFLMHDLRDQPTSLLADVHEIKAATDRAASLTRQLLAFSRRQLVKPQLLDLNVVVQEMETMLRRLIGEDTILVTEYAPDIGLARLDRGQIEQIVVNLVVNARDAMPGGGSIRLWTGIETTESERGARQCITLAVSDAGVGMDEPTRARIFEPFFTTKEQGKGTGLGLSTVYGIVKASGGDIIVESEVGAGTEFRLLFPRADGVAKVDSEEGPEPEALRGYETVLVVEDEEPLRRLTRRILESRGYTVLDAANGEEAIRALASAPNRVDLLLSDVVMPGMSGRELVERLLPVYPWLRVLFMSGYTEDTMLQHRVAELGIAVVEKPFTRDDLALAVRNALHHLTEPAGAG